MKLIILGGCADMAKPLIELLKNDTEVKEIILADRNEEKAKSICDMNGIKFTPAFCDANDHIALVSLIKGNDVVIAYIGPFYSFEKKMAKAAIDAGVNYVSIADDYDAYLDVITLEQEAKEKGVKILTGFGNSPGITQILARKGYNDVKNTHKIHVNWCAGSDESVGPSNLMHLFHIFNATTLQTFDGKEIPVKTGEGEKEVEFPLPIGKAKVYYTGHAESVSLPRNLPGLKEVTLHGGVKPNYIVHLVKFMSSLNFFATHERRVMLANLFHKIESWFSSKEFNKSVGRVDIYGDAYKYFTYVGHIADITSIPAYIASKWLANGKFNDMDGGVYSPEKILVKPEKFIDELKFLGIEIFESEML
ncbi:MAG: saccharopine dehydrogenase NADP-binding domain-containing protein [Desulfobacterales bacterium]|nr:saccharopine dehydrogenase NADP-binding domain-containing protein [Desulfobacterales bacterium]